MDLVDAELNEAATGMERRQIDCGTVPVDGHASRYRSAGGVDELHLMLAPTACASLETQLDWLDRAYRTALAACQTDESTAVLRRIFCSDPVNQAPILHDSPLAQPGTGPDACAVSCVGQAPIGPARVALWACHLCDPRPPLDKRIDGQTLVLRRGELDHHWTTGLVHPSGDSKEQTRVLLQRFDGQLSRHRMILADHVVRTWFFVRDIDTNYAGLVEARRAFFAARGLTADTHYIASSGIAGETADPRVSVMMDAYAIAGLDPAQVRYLKAESHLSPTAVYGVTFERGAAVTYRDRRHVIISGTASIDAQGRIVHPGDVARQLERTLENIDALLAEAGARAADMNSWIVYLRDATDHHYVRQRLRQRIGGAPMLIVHAPVCRPGWLVEIEGLATTAAHHPELPPF